MSYARPPVFHGVAPDDDAEDPHQTVGVKANAAVAHHTQCVRDWLAAPVHERAYRTERVKAAWLDLCSYGMATQSTAAMAANGLMRAQHKLRGRP